MAAPLRFDTYDAWDPDPAHRPPTPEEEEYMQEALGIKITFGPPSPPSARRALEQRAERGREFLDGERERRRSNGPETLWGDAA